MIFVKKLSISQVLKELDKLIVVGINITNQAQEGDAIYSANYDLLDDVHRRYFTWIYDIKKLLNRKEVLKKIDICVFYEADSVPHLKGGLEYGDVKSDVSQNFLKNIRMETSKKLKYLKDFQNKLSNKKFIRGNIIETEPKLLYNLETGMGYFEDKEFKFRDGTIEFKLFNEAYQNYGKKVKREKVIEILNISKEEKNNDPSKVFSAFSEYSGSRPKKRTTREVTITESLNNVVKKIRTKTGLSPKQFVNNLGNITLILEKPNPPQMNPK